MNDLRESVDWAAFSEGEQTLCSILNGPTSNLRVWACKVRGVSKC